MTVSERLTDAVLDVADQYSTENLNGFSLRAFGEHLLDVADQYSTENLNGFSLRAFGEHLLEELLPEVRDIDFLMALPVGSILLNEAGLDWVRVAPNTQPWLSVRGGGYGASTGDLREITERFVKHEAPFRLVWVP